MDNFLTGLAAVWPIFALIIAVALIGLALEKRYG